MALTPKILLLMAGLALAAMLQAVGFDRVVVRFVSAGVGGSQTRSAADDGRTPAEWGRRAQTE